MRMERTEYFLKLAKLTAKRGTCPRLRVGCVITDENNRIISTGYNGAPSGAPHCDEVGCLMVDGHCVGTIHAEMNAIANLRGKTFSYLIVYTTNQPCYNCTKLLIAAGAKRIWYLKSFKDPARDAFIETLPRQVGDPEVMVKW